MASPVIVSGGGRVAGRSGTVDQFLAGLDHPRTTEIERVRTIILGSNSEITEHIKWNAPSFCFRGDDRVTMRIHPPDRLQLILHRGAKTKDSANFNFDDDSGLVRWAAADRGVIKLGDLEEIERYATALAKLVNKWVMATTE